LILFDFLTMGMPGPSDDSEWPLSMEPELRLEACMRSNFNSRSCWCSSSCSISNRIDCIVCSSCFIMEPNCSWSCALCACLNRVRVGGGRYHGRLVPHSGQNLNSSIFSRAHSGHCQPSSLSSLSSMRCLRAFFLLFALCFFFFLFLFKSS